MRSRKPSRGRPRSDARYAVAGRRSPRSDAPGPLEVVQRCLFAQMSPRARVQDLDDLAGLARGRGNDGWGEGLLTFSTPDDALASWSPRHLGQLTDERDRRRVLLDTHRQVVCLDPGDLIAVDALHPNLLELAGVRAPRILSGDRCARRAVARAAASVLGVGAMRLSAAAPGHERGLLIFPSFLGRTELLHSAIDEIPFNIVTALARAAVPATIGETAARHESARATSKARSAARPAPPRVVDLAALRRERQREAAKDRDRA